MQDLTILLDDDVLAAAQAAASSQDTTVGQLVAAYLRALGQEHRTVEARGELLRLMDATTGRLDAGFAWNRENGYGERNPPLLPGHEHPDLRRSARSE
jgi:hypothetical protein